MVFWKYDEPFFDLKVPNLVWKVAATCALEPVARTRNGEDEDCTFRPARLRKLVTALVWAAEGAYRAANWPVLSHFW
jgi:hypothetical protein